MSIVLDGLLVAGAVVVFLASVIRAEAAALPVLAKARLDLLEDSAPWHGHPMKPHPHLFRLEGHPRYPDYLDIYRRENWQVMRRIGWGAAVAGGLILLNLV